MLDAAIQLVGEIHGLSFVCGLQKWPLCEQYGFKPYAPHLFSEKAGHEHRAFLSLFVLSFMKTLVSQGQHLMQSQQRLCLSLWSDQLLDFGDTGLLGHPMAAVLSQFPDMKTLFDGLRWQEAISGDGHRGPQIAGLIVDLLRRLVHFERGTLTATSITNKFHKVSACTWRFQ